MVLGVQNNAAEYEYRYCAQIALRMPGFVSIITIDTCVHPLYLHVYF